MKAYVELIQRKERELGTDVLTHQKVCGSLLALAHADKNFYSGAALIMPII